MAPTLKIVIVTDKFKGSLKSFEAAEIISEGLREGFGRELEIKVIPIADGGEGFLDTIACTVPCREIKTTVHDPLGREIMSSLLMSEGRAIIEMAKASGLQLLSPDEHNPLKTTSFGLGELIKAAVKEEAKEILIGIGGSATNDCGTGMLQALGYRFLDNRGRTTGSGPGEFMNGSLLKSICTVDDSLVSPSMHKMKITVACDVTNPLAGPDGATYIYGPQKGATKQQLEELEEGVMNFSAVTEKHLGFSSSFLCDSQNYIGFDLSDFPGAGAAGGMGFALKSYLNADLLQGWRVTTELTHAEKEIAGADLVITGEGRLDAQSLSGKLISGISHIAMHYKKPLWIFCGENTLTQEQEKKIIFDKIFTISKEAKNLNDSISKAKGILRKISVSAATFLNGLQSNRQTF
jgi:glycerate kinase